MSSRKTNQRRKLNTTSVEIYTREIRNMDSALHEAKKQCDDFRKSNNKLLFEKENLSRQVKNLKAGNENSVIIDQYENEVKGLRQTIKQNEDSIQNLEETIKSLENQNKRLKSIGCVKDRDIHNLQQEVRGLKEHIRELNTQMVDNERIKGMTQDFKQQFRVVLKEFQEDMLKDFREGMHGLKSEMTNLNVEMKGLKCLKTDIIDEVTQVVRNEMGEKCETRVFNLNHVDISSHLPMSSWE